MIISKIEAILFVSARPVSKQKLLKTVGVGKEIFEEAIASMKERYNQEDSGIHLIDHDNLLQFVSNPACAEILKAFVKDEMSGELTQPSLEALTIIAYRGPITKPELEQIRGVNCSLILRNLLIRGLVDEQTDKKKLQPVYTVSMDFMRHIGMSEIDNLPDYDVYHDSEKINSILEELQNSNTDTKEEV